MKAVVTKDKRDYSIATTLGIRESELDQRFYEILEQDPKELHDPPEDAVLKEEAREFLVPIPAISSVRDFFGFEEHVRNARSLRGEAIPEEWYSFPVFYFSNSHSTQAHLRDVRYPSYTQALDYEMELAFVIGREGRDIKSSDYEKYVLGVTIANDWSARDVQGLEMRVGLGPAKGKDFATSFGPALLSGRDLRSLKKSDGKYNIDLSTSVNGTLYGQGNMLSIYHSLGSMIQRASEDVTLYPGDVIMTGTFGNGCIAEHFRSGREWLRRGDVVTMHSDRIGDLENRVV